MLKYIKYGSLKMHYKMLLDAENSDANTWHHYFIGKYFTNQGRYNNTYQLLNLRALEFSHVNKIFIF